MPYPTDRKYTKEHEWIKVNGNTAHRRHHGLRAGITGRHRFRRTPKVGAELTAGKTFGTVESVKAVSDLFAPASGTVTEVNADLATSPEKVNKDAHGSWMLKMTLKNPSGTGCACSRRRTTRSLWRKRRDTERLRLAAGLVPVGTQSAALDDLARI